MTKRRYNTLGRRILNLLKPENGGPRKRSVLEGLAGSDPRLKPVLRRLLDAGQVVMLGDKRGARYALGRQAR